LGRGRIHPDNRTRRAGRRRHRLQRRDRRLGRRRVARARGPARALDHSARRPAAQWTVRPRAPAHLGTRRANGRAGGAGGLGVAEIVLERLTKVFADGTKAVAGLDLEVADGELVVFVGPSGCGKTTALRMIAGLEPITSGAVRIDDEVVNDLA